MGVKNIPLDTAGIISTVLEGILYGFSVFMYGATMWVLCYQKTAKRVNRPMVGAATMLFIMSTMHIGTDIQRIIEGLVDNRNYEPGGPPAWFADVSQFTFVFKNAIYLVQTVIGDGVVIYRCYVVWNSIYVVIFPLIMLCGVTVTGFGSVYSASAADPSVAGNVFNKGTGQWITAFYASTLSTNFIATILLVFRIWQMNRRVRNQKQGPGLMPVLLIMADAGLLYSITLFVVLICFVNKINGQYVVLDMVTPIISIAFYMVIIRVGVARSSTSDIYSSNTNVQRSSQNGDIVMRPLEVHITQLKENNVENQDYSVKQQFSREDA